MTTTADAVIKVQTVLYNTSREGIIKFFSSLAACEVPKAHQIFLHIGDCTAKNIQDQEVITFWRDEGGLNYWKNELARYNIRFEYTFFDANLGFGKGHNTLWQEYPVEGEGKLLIINPDAVFPYHLLTRLTDFADHHTDYGIIEARQIPLEHPKEFDLHTYETNWATGACSLFNLDAWNAVKGFDETFFMYSEDVDISWRSRAAGYRVYYCPDTFIYHIKRLTAEGMEMSWAEKHYGVISSLVLRAKYGRADLNKAPLEWLKNVGHTGVVAAYEAAIQNMTPATPAEKAVATFTDEGEFTNHRWIYRPQTVEV